MPSSKLQAMQAQNNSGILTNYLNHFLHNKKKQAFKHKNLNSYKQGQYCNELN